jgi:3-mercaptopyruvate sulfurtransferase SseA
VTAETKVPSKNDSAREYGAKEPMSPEKIMGHEPTAVKREMTEKITDGGETSTDSEEARQIARKSGMAIEIAGANKTDEEYEQDDAGQK